MDKENELKKLTKGSRLPTILGLMIAAILVVAAFWVRAGLVDKYVNISPQQDTEVLPRRTVLAAVGDISCPPDLAVGEDSCQMLAVRNALVKEDPKNVLVLGDLQYNSGEPENFTNIFAPLWEPLKSRSYAVPGNHEYRTKDASGYYSYWNGDTGSSVMAGDTGKGYYSLDINDWHIIALNSNCEYVGGCGEGSEQIDWLEKDLEAHKSNKCSLAFWHHPFFTSGRYFNDTVSKQRSTTFWEKLQKSSTEIVLNGHEHLYERFMPQNANGQADVSGIRQFTVGTGGYGYFYYPFQEPRLPTSEFGARTFGYLKLELKESSYAWEFIDINNQVLDHGVGLCTK